VWGAVVCRITVLTVLHFAHNQNLRFTALYVQSAAITVLHPNNALYTLTMQNYQQEHYLYTQDNAHISQQSGFNRGIKYRFFPLTGKNLPTLKPREHIHVTPSLKQLHWLPVKQRVHWHLRATVRNSLWIHPNTGEIYSVPAV